MALKKVMNENRFNPPINLPRQEGAVLIVALVLLVVLTMLGISGLEATKLETRMAASVHDYNQAFQRAEAGLAWTFRTCKQDLSNSDKVKEITQLPENYVSVPCGDQQQLNNKPGQTDLKIKGLCDVRTNGIMSEIVYLARSTGSSMDDSNDPNAIKVTLVEGMKLLGAFDPRTLKTGTRKSCTPSCALEDKKSACESESDPLVNTPERISQCKDAINQKVADNPNITQCKNELISEACSLLPNPPITPTSTCEQELNK